MLPFRKKSYLKRSETHFPELFFINAKSLTLPGMTSYFLRNSVSFIKLSNPPVNGLSLAVRDGIMRGLDQARADKTRGVVFYGEGKNFCAGGDITEFARHQHSASPSLNEV